MTLKKIHSAIAGTLLLYGCTAHYVSKESFVAQMSDLHVITQKRISYGLNTINRKEYYQTDLKSIYCCDSDGKCDSLDPYREFTIYTRSGKSYECGYLCLFWIKNNALQVIPEKRKPGQHFLTDSITLDSIDKVKIRW